MGIIKIKEIEYHQDDRGWCIRPIMDNDIKNGIISDIHMVSMKPGAVRGNHYHANKTESILIIGSTCRILIVDNNTKEKEERIIENGDRKLFIFPPDVTHAIENVGKEISYLFCFSNVHNNLKCEDIIKNKII